jgi:hypothetical protein
MLFREPPGFFRPSLASDIKKGFDNLKIIVMLLGNEKTIERKR